MSFPIRTVALAVLCAAVAAPALAAPPAKSKTSAAKSKTAPLDSALQDALRAAPKASDFPDADYARLLDLADITVKPDGTVVAEYRETLKLFNERARHLAEVTLPYNSSYQHVEVVRARTIKKDGTVINVAPSDIRLTSPYSEYLMYDDAHGTSFSMPAIEDDCVIDYTWKEETRPIFMPGQFSLYWGFNGPEPVSLSRFVLHVPRGKTPQFRVVNDPGMKPIVTNTLNGLTTTYTYEKRDMKPMELEPAMPSPSELRTYLEVSSLGSWQNIAQWYWNLAKPQAQATDAIRQTVAGLTKGQTTPEGKARAIYDWVANHTRYVGLEFGLSAYRPHPASDVHDKLYGDCKDKATLLVTMLGLAGIKAYPVLLHAEDRKQVDSGLPTLNAFNHCIALADVNGKEVWLDATAETCAFGDIPAGDRGVQALVVDNGKGTFKTIPSYNPEDNGMEATAKVTLHADGSADTETEVKMSGASGQAMRAAMRAQTPEKRKLVAQKIAQTFATGATLQTYTLPDGIDKIGPYALAMRVTAPNYAKRVGSLLLVPVSGAAGRSNVSSPFTQEKRTWPIVDEDASQSRSQTVITVPDGYAVEELPAEINLTGPLKEYRRTAVASPDGRTVTITVTMTDRAGSVPSGDYSKVRAYYDAMLKTIDDQLVLKKVSK